MGAEGVPGVQGRVQGLGFITIGALRSLSALSKGCSQIYRVQGCRVCSFRGFLSDLLSGLRSKQLLKGGGGAPLLRLPFRVQFLA